MSLVDGSTAEKRMLGMLMRCELLRVESSGGASSTPLLDQMKKKAAANDKVMESMRTQALEEAAASVNIQATLRGFLARRREHTGAVVDGAQATVRQSQRASSGQPSSPDDKNSDASKGESAKEKLKRLTSSIQAASEGTADPKSSDVPKGESAKEKRKERELIFKRLTSSIQAASEDKKNRPPSQSESAREAKAKALAVAAAEKSAAERAAAAVKEAAIKRAILKREAEQASGRSAAEEAAEARAALDAARTAAERKKKRQLMKQCKSAAADAGRLLNEHGRQSSSSAAPASVVKVRAHASNAAWLGTSHRPRARAFDTTPWSRFDVWRGVRAHRCSCAFDSTLSRGSMI